MSYAGHRLTDAELVRRCRANDADAWDELVERYSRYVYAIAVRGFRLSDEDAEDVFQDVFTRIYTRLDSLRDDSALRPWIAQLTRRRCLDVFSARRDSPAEEVLAEEGSTDLSDVEEAFEVREALAELSEPCQDILDRFFTRDQSYKTIADQLDIPRALSQAALLAAWLAYGTSSREETTRTRGLGSR